MYSENGIHYLRKNFAEKEFRGKIITQEKIRFQNKTVNVNALWDTGSSFSLISKHFFDNNFSYEGVNKIGKTFESPYGSLANPSFIGEYYLDNIPMGNIQLDIAQHISDKEIDMIIGLDIISCGCFSFYGTEEGYCLEFSFMES